MKKLLALFLTAIVAVNIICLTEVSLKNLGNSDYDIKPYCNFEDLVDMN